MNKKLKVKNRIFLITTILLVGVLSGCSNKTAETNNEVAIAPQKASFSNITPEQAKKRLESEKDIILLDVRTKEEFETGHIKDAVLVPVDNLKDESGKVLMNKEAPIFVYCRSGNRSVTAANILIEQGYKNVYNLGGIINWPYEVVNYH
jgi:phage shock protein E